MHIRPITKRLGVAAIAIAMASFALTGCGGHVGPSEANTGGNGPITIGLLPKFTSDPYFTAVNQGAQEAAKELGVKVVYNGPVNADTSAQSQTVSEWQQAHFSAITVSANDGNAIAPALAAASKAGVKVSAYDADWSQSTTPHPFMNQVTPDLFGETLAKMAADQSGGKGNFLLMTSVLTAPNQNAWIEGIKKAIAAHYPGVKIAATLPGNEDLATSKSVATNYLQAHPDTTGILTVDGVALAGAAQAVQQAGLSGKVIVTGVGVPSTVGSYIKSGVVKQAALWDPKKLGYATVYMAVAQIKGTLPSSGTFHAGQLGDLKFIDDHTILLGQPLIFDATNVDNYKF